MPEDAKPKGKGLDLAKAQYGYPAPNSAMTAEEWDKYLLREEIKSLRGERDDPESSTNRMGKLMVPFEENGETYYRMKDEPAAMPSASTMKNTFGTSKPKK